MSNTWSIQRIRPNSSVNYLNSLDRVIENVKLLTISNTKSMYKVVLYIYFERFVDKAFTIFMRRTIFVYMKTFARRAILTKFINHLVKFEINVHVLGVYRYVYN